MNDGRYSDRETTLYNATVFANHLKMCSCNGCGNPRKHFGDITNQEKKSNIGFKQQLNELYYGY